MRVALVFLLACGVSSAAITCIGTAKQGRNSGFNPGPGLGALVPSMAQGDVIVVSGGHPYREGANLGPITAGYVEIASSNASGAAQGVWYKIVGETPDDTIICYGTGNADDAGVYVAHVLRGVDTSHVADTIATTATGSSTNPDPAAIVTVTDSVWVVVCGGSIVGDNSPGTITNYTNNVYIGASDVNSYSAAACTRQIASAGSEDPGAWNSWDAGVWRVYTVAIRPATGGAPATGGGEFLPFFR